MAPTRELELIRPLGQGGFGTVWLATLRGRDGFSRRVAVKVMRDAPSQPAEIIARQRDEARLLGLLQHPNIVQVLDLTEFDGAPAVVMEHVEGVDVATLLKLHGAMPGMSALAVASAAAAALDAGWNARSPETGRPLRVIHRDIKPANILVTIHGTVKVLDFGVARADFDREGRTQSMAFGTPRFMAPEQFLAGEVTPGNDVYALGVTLWEMLLGRTWERPPLGEEPFGAKVELQVLQAPPEVQPLLRSMMRWSTRSRPTAADVALALDEILLGGETLRGWSRRVMPAAMETQAKMAPPSTPSQAPAQPTPSTPQAANTAAEPSTPQPGIYAAGGEARAAAVASGPPSPSAASSSSANRAGSTPAGSLPDASLGRASRPPTPTGVAAQRILGGYSPKHSVERHDPDASLATPAEAPLGPESAADHGKLAVGAAGAVAGMALVAGIVLVAGGGWWWYGREVPIPAENGALASQLDAEKAPEESAADDIPAQPTDPIPPPVPATVTGPSTSPGTATKSATRITPNAETRRAIDSLDSPESPPAATTPPVAIAPVPEPAPPVATPVEPAPSPAPLVETKSLNVVADSIGWEVFLDGKSIGKTPLRSVSIPYGNHQVRLVNNGNSAQRSFDMGPTTGGTLKYSAAEDRWTWAP